MVTRAMKIVGALLISLVGIAGTAHAYPPGGTVVTTDKSSYVSGSVVNITAAGFQACAGAVVTFTITLPGGPTTTVTIPAASSGIMRSAAAPAVVTGNVIVLTSIANADGTATVTLIAPATLGVYTVVATSPGCPNASTTFTVIRQPTTPGLPQTGTDVGQWVLNAGLVVLIGGLFVMVAWRRRKSA